MPPNAFVLIAVALSVIKGGLAVGLLIAAGRAIQARRTTNDETGAESMVGALAVPVVALTLAGLPLVYLVLQRWQTELPGAMCLYGVIHFGSGQRGPTGWLPGLFSASSWLNSGVLFAAGCWATCRAIENQGVTTRSHSHALVLAWCLGITTLVAAGTETAFLAIPRELASTSTGCCVVTSAIGAEAPLEAVTPAMRRSGWIAFLAVNIALLACLLRILRRKGPGNSAVTAWEWVLPALAATGAVVTVAFARGAFPTQILGLPYHPCVYDLAQRAPETVLAFGVYFAGIGAAGCALLAKRLYRESLRDSSEKLVAPLFGFCAHAVVSCLVIVCVAGALEGK